MFIIVIYFHGGAISTIHSLLDTEKTEIDFLEDRYEVSSTAPHTTQTYI